MRIASALRGDDELFGLVVDDHLIDLSGRYPDVVTLLTEGHNVGPAEGESIALDGLTLLPPVPLPRRILCVGTNYHDHVAESDRVSRPTDHPMIFTRFPSSFVGHGQPIERPSVSTSFDYEGELAVIIGRRTRYADRAAAREAVGAYACLMDGTLRDYQRHTSQFTAGKNFERSGAWGPWMVTADEIDDHRDLTLTTTVGGEVVQSATTRQLIFDISEIIVYCSTFTTLEPGDVIATGTPGGVGYARTPPRWLEPGDEVSVTVSEVGTLSNPVVDGP